MESSVFQYDPTAGKGVLRLRQAPWAGRNWEIGLSVCANPFCGCTHVEFDCIPSVSGPANTLRFWLDVQKQELFRGGDPMPSPESMAFGEAVAAELHESDWTTLAEYLYKSKHRLIEEADVNLLDADFPEDVLSGDGYMVGYAEIFPLGGAFRFEIDTEIWLADDQYCVNPGCRCREVLLSFFRLSRAAEPVKDSAMDAPAAFYDYRRGSFKTAHAPAAGQPALPAIFQALKQAHPELDRDARKRHQRLKTLYRHALERAADEGSVDADLEPSQSEPLPRPDRPAAIKAGRNDPCPCGSGKKYKKCCGK